ncbi:MAG: hypothetical protein JO058_03325 [Alphaproteobacteria bacterium]|nr:hypothetical protein [Alphaproteobacteria bacterium]
MGKTTMSKLVVQRLIANDDGLIPLPLVLHGPTLLRPDGDDHGGGAEAEPTQFADPRVSEAQQKILLKRWVLRGLIAALYRHLCTHFIEAWDNACAIKRPWWHSLLGAGRPARELHHLRGHLDLRLDEAPNVTVLRQIWRRAGFLHGGVLPMLYPCHTRPRLRRRDQGIREIAALAGCAHSYLTIIGNPDEMLGNRSGSGTGVRTGGIAKPENQEAPGGGKERKDPVSDTAVENIRRIGPPALATLAATAIGVANQPVWAIVIGAAVYIAGWLAASLRRDEFAEMRRELTVHVDWSERRLERELPMLLRRVKDAGFAPIFILDELDKLDDDVNSLHRFIDFAKHIVRDHAAFLFLVHRDYFERLIMAQIPGAQNKAHGKGYWRWME